MYFCTVNINSRVMIFTSIASISNKASKLSALRRFELIWKDSDTCGYQYNNNNEVSVWSF